MASLRGARPLGQRLWLSSHQKVSALALTQATRPLNVPYATPQGGLRLLRHCRSRLAPAAAHVAVAGFHSSSMKSILPPPPQRIEGTVNDPAILPPPSPTHGSYHWTFERLLSGALIPLTIAPFAAGSLHPATDAALGAAILIHSHLGFQSIIIDYIPTGQHPLARKIFWWSLRGATLVVGIGLYEFETNDVGLTEAIKRLWRA